MRPEMAAWMPSPEGNGHQRLERRVANRCLLVLCVDAQVGIQRLIKQELGVQGFQVMTATRAGEALAVAAEERPDVVLVEQALPDMSGLELMRRLREEAEVPVIFVSGSTSQMDKIRALELGADDYVVKPFDPQELAARVRAVYRRTVGVHQLERTIRAEGVEIDLNRRVVRRHGEVVDLTRTEWLLLQHLAANAGRVMLNEELLTKVWGAEYRGDLQYLRVWISRLRHKLESSPSNWTMIRTVKGIGYILETAPEPPPAVAA